MKVKQLAKVTGRPLITIGENDTVDDAIQKLIEHHISALPVCDSKGFLVGIVSERDFLAKCSAHSKDVPKTKMKDIMTRDVVVCVPEDDLDYVMGVMTQKGIRHVPIMVGARPEGIISIRDLIEERLEACQLEVRTLSDFISGGYV